MAVYIMSNLEKKLSETLNVEIEKEEELNNLPVVESKNEITPIEQAANEDTEFARDNIKNLINKGSVALDNLLQVARESEHPRAYEVAATMIKNLSDSNKDLLDLQKKRKDLSPSNGNIVGNTKNMNIDKAVFVGSTTELVKFLKNKQEE
jgi:hypothetical protein